MSARCLTLSIACLFATTALAGEPASFVPLGHLAPGASSSIAFDVSADGSVVVGTSKNELNENEGFVWTAQTGMVGFDDFGGGQAVPSIVAVSADGTVIAGNTNSGPFRWTAGVGLVPLGNIGGISAWALDMSSDGRVIVGYGDNGQLQTEAFRWTEQTGMVNIGSLPAVHVDCFAFAANGDGSVIAGQSQSGEFNVEPTRWTAQTGMVGLGDLPGGLFYGLGLAISDDGSIIVGEAISDVGWESFRWTAQAGLQSLDPVASLTVSTFAHGISGDGAVVVGSAGHVGGAATWDLAHGYRSVQQLLESDHGLDLTGWTLLYVEAISNDRKTLVGYGRNPADDIEAWMARIPDLLTDGDFDGDGDVDLSDFSKLSLCFGGANTPPAGSCPLGIHADFDNDGDVDLGDFAAFSLNFTGAQ